MPLYSDIDINFTRHPGTGDVVKLVDTEAVKNALTNLIMGSPFDRPFDEFYGAGTSIRGVLFENFSPATEIIVKRILSEKVRLYEPRVSVFDVKVNYNKDELGSTNLDQNRLSLDITYQITGYQTQTLRLDMNRIR